MSSLAQRPRAPAFWLLLPLIAGLSLAYRWSIPIPSAWSAGMALGLAILAAWTAWRGWPHAWAALQVASLGLAGIALLQIRLPHLHERDPAPPRETTVVAQVEQLYAAAESSRSVSGLARITTDAVNESRQRGRAVYFSVARANGPLPQRAGIYRIHGVLEPVPASATQGFEGYLAANGIRHRLVRALVREEVSPPPPHHRFYATARRTLRRWLSEGLDRWPAQRSMYLGILLGEKAELAPAQQAAFVRSGTFHIFSVSGLHVGTIALALGAAAWWTRLPLRWSAVVIVPTLWCYVQITGGSSPALRAFLMVAFLLSSRVFALPGNALAALAISALVTLLLDPVQLFSSGFQMSYTVVGALIAMGGPLSRQWVAHWRPFSLLPPADWRWWHHAINKCGTRLVGSLATCWTAFVASTPAAIAYFGLLSPVSLIANLAAVPLSSGILYLGLAAITAGAIGLASLAGLLNRVAVGLVMLTERTAFIATGWDAAFIGATFRAEWLGPVALAGTTAVLLAGAAGGWSRRRGGFLLPVAWLALLLIFGVKFGSGAQSSLP